VASSITPPTGRARARVSARPRFNSGSPGSRSDPTRFLMKLIAHDAHGREPLRQFRTV
jgi:hypothetical protein